jgi:alpha-tubulin suppressor-like RCC1 family protein
MFNRPHNSNRRSVCSAISFFVAATVLATVPTRQAQADQNEHLESTEQASITAGGFHACAIVNGTGKVRCWGDNQHGQLGLGNTNTIGNNELPTVANSTVNLGGATAIAVTTGDVHTCALLTGGAVRCWGRNILGELGLGSLGNVGDNEIPTVNVNLGPGVTATAIAAGGNHTCAILTGGAVRCWGANTVGQLGLGTVNDVGDDELPTANTNLGAGVTATAIAVGQSHTCAILTGGAVRCWGTNFGGELGLGNTNQIGDDESPTTNINFGAGVSAYAISAGIYHTCALLSSSIFSFGFNVRCWGRNNFGQLGLGHRLAIGDNESPTTNTISGGTFAISAGGGDHTCALLLTGALRCWGANESGQLGIGNTNNIGDNELPTENVFLPGGSATAVTTGYGFSCAVLTTVANVRCWGKNTSGELGLGNTTPLNAASKNIEGLLAGPDTVNPTNTLVGPTSGASQVSKLVAISGVARDNAGITAVYVAIYRPIGSGQHWNGTAWQTTYVPIPAELFPSTGQTDWLYYFDPPQTGGNYWVTSMAVDPSNKYVFTPFIPFSVADNIKPTATLAPASGSTTTGTITITGTASDNSSVWGTYVAVYQYATGNYWNGTGWQTTFTTVPATLATPGTTSSAYTYTFTPPTPGFYLIGALPIDSNYNYTFVAWNTINVT